jgi:hypothetical protein
VATNFWNTLNKYYKRSGDFTKQVEISRNWFRQQALRVNVEPEQLMKTRGPMGARDRLSETIDKQMIGRMILFFYDPKTKDKLPYYDRFPMIFPFRVKKDRFWGINLHYLPLNLRAKLMDGLHEIFEGREKDETNKLRLTYKLLNTTANLRWFRPCIKQYLFSHVRSRFNRVDPKEWNFVLFLPLERFEKATKSKVWEDSRKKIGD